MDVPTTLGEAVLSGGAIVALGLVGALWFVATGDGVNAALLCVYSLTGVGLFASHRDD